MFPIALQAILSSLPPALCLDSFERRRVWLMLSLKSWHRVTLSRVKALSCRGGCVSQILWWCSGLNVCKVHWRMAHSSTQTPEKTAWHAKFTTTSENWEKNDMMFVAFYPALCNLKALSVPALAIYSGFTSLLFSFQPFGNRTYTFMPIFKKKDFTQCLILISS